MSGNLPVRLAALLVAWLFLMISHANVDASPKPASAMPQTDREISTLSPDEWGRWGIDLNMIDDAVAPGDDFYEYVNGRWLSTFELPGNSNRYGAGSVAAEKARQQVQFIIADLTSAAAPPDSNTGKIARFYKAFNDRTAITERGLEPSREYLDEIDRITNRQDLARAFARPYYASPFDTGVFVDWRNPKENITFTSIGGLALPTRDHYLQSDKLHRDLRADYLRLLTYLLEVTGHDAAEEAALAVLQLETAMAQADWAPVLERNPDLTYNKLSWSEFREMMGDFPVDDYAEAAGLQGATAILVTEIPPTAEELKGLDLKPDQLANLRLGFPALSTVIQETEIATWKAYLTAHFMIDYAAVLPREVEANVFDFFGKQLRGQQAERPRETRAAIAVSRAFSDAIGEVYVERHFSKEQKRAATEMAQTIAAAMGDSLRAAKWMGDDTRAEALRKLEGLNMKIGYPDAFKDYSDLQISDDALANAIAVKKFEWAETTNRLGQPVDRGIWFYPAQRVGGYYATAFNEIVFPAAILQAPFFNPSADPAVNYGSIGGIIGHEITHAFDDEGARYDANGVLRNWWSEEYLEAFREARSRLVTQFDGYCPLDDGQTCVNGSLTLGENLADLGGVALAYRAYRASLNGKEPPVLDGFTGDQRFFMAWAQVYRFKVRDEVTRRELANDPHSPAQYRVNGIVRNLDAWYKAFNVGKGHELYLPPEDRVQLW